MRNVIKSSQSGLRALSTSVSSRIFAAVFAIAAMNFTLFANAAAAPDLWEIWADNDADSTQVIDHSAWDELLSTYVVPREDQLNLVAYKQFSSADTQKLVGYIEQLSSVDPTSLNPQEQMAYWINFYNALTVKVVLDYPKKKSILRMGEKFFAIGPWDDKLVTVNGEKVTLNDIEHRILRPLFKDRRIHYAVNCASIGCPNLANEAFTAANLEEMLAAAERGYLHHPRGVTFDDKGRLLLSQIYEWYGSDFAADEAALVAYIAENHDTLGEKIQSYTGKVRYDYDWSLNGVK